MTNEKVFIPPFSIKNPDYATEMQGHITRKKSSQPYFVAKAKATWQWNVRIQKNLAVVTDIIRTVILLVIIRINRKSLYSISIIYL